MKKLLIPSLIFILLSMNSCIKKYNWNCYGFGAPMHNAYPVMTKSKAKKNCADHQAYLVEEHHFVGVKCVVE